MRAANRIGGEWLRKAKEDKKRKRQWKLQVRERGEDIDNDDDDDDVGDEDEVANNIEWDILENEDALIGIGSSLQELGPFLFHGGEGMSGEPAEARRTVSLPQESTRVGGSTTVPKMSTEAGGSIVVPQELRGASPSAQEQGVGSKQLHPDEAEQRSGGLLSKRICRPTALRRVVSFSIFSVFIGFHRDLCFSSHAALAGSKILWC